MAQTKQNATKAFSWRRWLPIGLVIVFMAVAFSQGWHKQLSLAALIENRERLRDFVESNFAFMAFGYMGLYILVVVLSLPGAGVLTLTGGFLFGWLFGGLMTVLAATVGATLLFLIVQTAFGRLLKQKTGPYLDKLRAGFQENAFYYLLFLRLVPLFPFFAVNLAPALLGIQARTYVIATFLGIIPGTFAYALIGSGLDSVIEAQRAANTDCIGNAACAIEISIDDLVTMELLIAFGALALVALIPVVLQKLRRQSTR